MKLLDLTKGQFAIIDDDDYDRVIAIATNWFALPGRNTFYAMVKDGDRYIYLHRVIANAHWSDNIDHINRDGLDCRKENLRKVTPSENLFNARLRKDSSSGHKGVSFMADRQKWRAYVTRKGKQYSLGYFLSKEEAVTAVTKYYGKEQND